MGKKKRLSKVVSLVLLFTLIFSSSNFSMWRLSYADYIDEVSLEIDELSDLDVVLSVGNTSEDVSSFEEDLKSKLIQKGISEERIKIDAVEATEVDAQSNFDWEIYDHTNYSNTVVQYYKPYYNEIRGNYTLNNHINVSQTDGKTYIDFYGYGAPAYKDFMYMPEEEKGKKTFDFTIQEGEFYDALDGAGFLFNTSMTSNEDLANRKMSGYLLFFNYVYSNPPPSIEIYKFTNIDVNSFHNNASATIGEIPSLYPGFSKLASYQAGDETTRKVTIEVTPSNLQMKYNDALINWNLTEGGQNTIVPLDTDFGSYGFGPLVGYSSHGCSRHTHFTFNDVTMATENTKGFLEILREPEWRETAKHFVVNLDEQEVNGLDNGHEDLPEILTRMDNNEIHYLGWGSNTNKTQAIGEDGKGGFIAKNSGRGTFVNIDDVGRNYEGDIDRLATYIYNEYISSIKNNITYLTAGKPFLLNITPASEAINTADGDWTNGKWRVDHKPDEFDNSLGTISYDGKYLSDMDVFFEKPGKYDIYYKDTFVKTIYVHRKPVSSFNVSVDDFNNITITDNSYDPDAESQPNKGIVSKIWRYKETSDVSWTNGKPTTFDDDKSYIIQLQIEDEQGEKSIAYSRYVSTATSGTSIPIAEFTISPSSFIKGITNSSTITINDTSYDPMGKAITKEEWTVTEGSTTILNASDTPMTDFSSQGGGEYKISLRVKNDDGDETTWSEVFTRTLTIIEDNIDPIVTIDSSGEIIHENGDYDLDTANTITLNYSDSGGSGLAYQKYAITNSSTTLESSDSVWSIESNNSTRTVDFKETGTWYLHYSAVDNAGNEISDHYGPYTIQDNSSPDEPIITMETEDGIAYKSDTWTAQNVNVMLSGSTDSSGFVIYQYSTDGDEWKDSKSFTINNEGTTTIYYRAIDKSANASNANYVTINIDKIDPDTPKILVQEESQHLWTNKNIDIMITASDNGEAGIEKIEYELSGATEKVKTIYNEETIKISNEGTTKITAYVTDKAGNTSQSEKTLNIDKTSPEIPSIIKYPDRDFYNDEFEIELISEDNNGSGVFETVYRVVYEENNSGWQIYDRKFVISREGTTEIEAKATDNAGNISKISKTVVNINKNINVFAKIQINPDMEYSNEDYVITLLTMNSDESVNEAVYSQVYYKLDNTDDFKLYKNPFIVDKEGKTNVTVKIIDRSGNESIITRTLNLDKTPPQVFGVKEGETYKEYKTITFSAGTATLNNEPFHSGDKVEANGTYKLIVADEVGNKTVIDFTIDNDNETVKKDKEELELVYASGDTSKRLTKDITLSTEGDNGIVITWTSSHPQIISNAGEILSYPSENTVIILTAKITKGDATATKEFKVTIYADVVAPTITLLGNQEVTLEQGQLYIEKGYTANDDVDGNLTDNVVREGIIDTQNPGTYRLVYKVADTSKNEALAERVIVVKPKEVAKEAVINANNEESIEDKKISDAIKGAKQKDEQVVKVIVDQSVTKEKPIKIDISKNQIKNAKNNNLNLVLETDNTAIEVPIRSVDTDNMGTTSRLELVVEQVDSTEKMNMELKNINSDLGIYDSHVYDFKMVEVEKDESGNETRKPIAFTSDEDIELTVKIGENKNEYFMTFYFNETTEKWEYVRGKYNKATGEVNLFTKHLSIYSVTNLSKEAKLEELTKLINDGDITIDEVLNILEDEDLDFDQKPKYNELKNRQKEDVAEKVINDRPEDGYPGYSGEGGLEEKLNETVYNMYEIVKGDNISPTIEIQGNNQITLYVGQSYNEPGAKANDNLEGDITGKITVYGEVDTSIAGDYTLRYVVEDLAENETEVTRIVIVRNRNSNSDSKDDKSQVVEEDTEQYNTVTFKDIQGHWAQETIEFLASRQIINGDGQGNFNPNTGITRAEFATLITKTLGLEIEAAKTGFVDIDGSEWYAPYIATAREYGIVQGVSDTKYEPHRIVNRQEMTAMVLRAYKLVEDLKVKSSELDQTKRFKDDSSIGNWAREDIYTAKYLNLITGRTDEIFVPTGETLRGEAAVLIYRFLESIGKI